MEPPGAARPNDSAEDRAAFDRDGFVKREEFLPRDEFERLRAAVMAHSAPAREMLQGEFDHPPHRRRSRVPRAPCRSQGAARDPDWRGLNLYVGSFDQEPMTYVQAILSHVRNSAPDPQTDLHSDTFHPTVKAF